MVVDKLLPVSDTVPCLGGGCRGLHREGKIPVRGAVGGVFVYYIFSVVEKRKIFGST